MTKKQQSWVMASLLLVSIMSGIDATIINTVLPVIIFDILQIKVQQDAKYYNVKIATSISYLIRTLVQTCMSSIYGVTVKRFMN